MAVAQEVERVAHRSEDQWSNPLTPWLLQSVCQSVLNLATESQIAPEGCAMGVWLCVYVCEWALETPPDEQVGALHGSLCERVNVGM